MRKLDVKTDCLVLCVALEHSIAYTSGVLGIGGDLTKTSYACFHYV